MIVTACSTIRVKSGTMSLNDLIDQSIHKLAERSVVVVTSKVVSLCEGRTLPVGTIDKDELIYREADWYHKPDDRGPATRYHYTIVNNTLIPAAGIDESNGNGNFILWPRDPLASANAIRKHLQEQFGLASVGVIITDSTILPSRWGTMGIAIAHSGFQPVKDYIGQPDLFGRTLKMSKANIAGGLAAAAVLCMGEATEQTPIAIMGDVPFVEFQAHDPTAEECREYYVSPLDDEPFMPFFRSVQWVKGNREP